ELAVATRPAAGRRRRSALDMAKRVRAAGRHRRHARRIDRLELALEARGRATELDAGRGGAIERLGHEITDSRPAACPSWGLVACTGHGSPGRWSPPSGA